MKRAVILDPTAPEELAFLQGHAPGVALVAPAPGEDAVGLLRDASVIVSKRIAVDGATLAAVGSGLKLVQLWSNRPDRIDRAAARRAGVPVALMPQRGCIAVAECALLLLLGLSKKVVAAHQATVSGAYRERGVEPVVTAERLHKFQWMQLPGLYELHGRKLGLVGFGEIATEVARRARAFGMEVGYWSRRRASSEIEDAEGVRYLPFAELLAWADAVSLHVPHTAETSRLIDAAALARMKPSAVLVNTCRGGVVDEAALVAALHAGALAGAGLDVFVQEPIPFDHPLLRAPNTLLLPHLGGGSGGARAKHAEDVMANVVAAIEGRPVRHLVA
ncbi:MAG: phosphoglycerate dehydrogenase [Alphaproteobacteria bacterium]|nr:phosphoglycerate dehydrogenase [Alphaproteobacteria bacterium]